MRTIHLIVIHCSATKENETLTEIELEKSHRQRGLNGIGYHYYIRRDGNIKSTRSVRNPELMPKGIILTASLYVMKVVLTGTDFPKIHALNGKSTP